MEYPPRVSLVTPTYNQANFLVDTIESVLAQDYPLLEYIVLDDGSTDETPDILQRYNGRIRHERHENIGQASTLNKGWKMASGSLIGYLSSDDLLEPTAITELVHTLLDRPEASMAYCDYCLIDVHGKKFRTIFTEEFSESRLKVDLICQAGPGALFRRDLFCSIGGWSSNLHQFPDFEFWLRMSQFGPFVRIPSILASHRVHEDSASFRAVSPQRSMEIVDIMKDYWIGQHGTDVNRSIATAHLVAARSHGQSGRFIKSVTQWVAALVRHPSLLLSGRSWRFLVSAMFRRAFYWFKDKRKT